MRDPGRDVDVHAELCHRRRLEFVFDLAWYVRFDDLTDFAVEDVLDAWRRDELGLEAQRGALEGAVTQTHDDLVGTGKFYCAEFLPEGAKMEKDVEIWWKGKSAGHIIFHFEWL